MEKTSARLTAVEIGAALGERATLVQFSTAFCQPCRATRRTLAEVAGMVPGVAHVEVDAEARLELVRALGVTRTPTTLVLDAAGREVRRASGVPRRADVIAALGAATEAAPDAAEGRTDAATTAPTRTGDAAGGRVEAAAPTRGEEAARDRVDEAGHASATPELFRSVFRRHAAGVAVITARGAAPVGFTATSLTSVAAEPPLLSFGVSTGSSSWPVLATAEHVGVHVLAEDQRELAATFARSGADRFGPATRWHPGPFGIPLLADVSAWLVGRVVARVPAGDHRMVIVEALTGAATGPDRPLLYHQGGFHRLAADGTGQPSRP